MAGADLQGAMACALDIAAGSGARWLVLERTPADGPVRGALDAAVAAPGATPVAILGHRRPVLHRRPAPDYLDGRLSTQRRKNLRRQRRRLEEELGPVRARDLGATDHEGALERLLALEAAGWKGRGGTALASNSAHASFFREATGAAARRGAAQVWVLEAGDTTVAALCAVVDGRGAFHLKTAYDERYARA